MSDGVRSWHAFDPLAQERGIRVDVRASVTAIEARAAIQDIVALITKQLVAAGFTEQLIIAGPAADDIVASSGPDHIVPAESLNDLVFFAFADNHVAGTSADEPGGEIRAGRPGIVNPGVPLSKHGKINVPIVYLPPRPPEHSPSGHSRAAEAWSQTDPELSILRGR